MKIGIYYGSTTGNAQSVAEQIRDAFSGDEVVCVGIAQASADELKKYDLLILGSSTWGDGDLQDDWEAFLPQMKSVSLAGKAVALFGVGDQFGWSDTFVDALALLHDAVVACDGRVFGAWPVDGYEHASSKAVVDGKFLGLAIDESNQSALTASRIAEWVAQLRTALAAMV